MSREILSMSLETRVKQEIEYVTSEADGRLFTVQVHIKEETEQTEVTFIKQEPPESNVSEAATTAWLYNDHEVWGQLVLGPETVQQKKAVEAASDLNHEQWITLKGPTAEKKTVSPQDYILQHTIVDNSYECGACSKTFQQKHCLIKHIKLQCGKENHKDIFRKSSEHMKKQKQNLNNHQCMKGGKPYACELCKKKFRLLTYLKRHKHVHAVEKSFSCDICKKVFSRSDQLNMHKRCHTGLKPHGCGICLKQFAELKTLKTHSRIHTGVKPFCCNVCKREFGQLGNMKRHELIHTGERPFCCDVCSKQFIALSDLKRHKRTHTNERPYSCEICEKKFRVSSQLTRHKRTHQRKATHVRSM